jgi:nicotinate-nucleotide adenylyltransferase
MTERVAVYGGSFDPPHIAHALVAAYVLSAHPVDRVLVVPTAQHPFSKNLASFEDRLEMCRIAMRHVPRVEVSAIESELNGPSLTLHTLQELKRRMPHAALRFVLGSDLVTETPKWHAFDEIEKLAPPIVVNRMGHPCPEEGLAMPAISSSEIQKLLRTGGSTQGLLDADVARYVQERGLYK